MDNVDEGATSRQAHDPVISRTIKLTAAFAFLRDDGAVVDGSGAIRRWDMAWLAEFLDRPLEDDGRISRISTQCPTCGGKARLWIEASMPEFLLAECRGKCRGDIGEQAVHYIDEEQILARARDRNRKASAHRSRPQPPKAADPEPPGPDPAEAILNGTGKTSSPEQQLLSGKLDLADRVKQWAVDGGFRALYPKNEEFQVAALEQIHFLIKHKKVRGFENLTESEIGEEVQPIIDEYLPVPAVNNGKGPIQTVPNRSVLIWEDQAAAVTANEEYLARPAIVEQLLYAQAISLDVGGKHHGKSTSTRTEAMAINRGLPLWGRQTTQGHVIYAVSDDELATTRMELLRMGWDEKHDALKLVHMDPEKVADPLRMMEELAEGALKHGSIFIILDMLFDFAGIKDEMAYAHTREARGKIQKLADWTKAHVKATQHSPKWMPDAATAATAALGSQGLAARFSPIMLTRKWTDTLFSIESTMTRDPRGLAIPPTVVTLDENGWSQAAGPFKDFMKWELYAPRVMGLFEGNEPGKEMTVAAIARDVEIDRARAQNVLYQLWKRGDLARESKGKAHRMYYSLPKPEQTPLLQS